MANKYSQPEFPQRQDINSGVWPLIIEYYLTGKQEIIWSRYELPMKHPFIIIRANASENDRFTVTQGKHLIP